MPMPGPFEKYDLLRCGPEKGATPHTKWRDIYIDT